MISLLAATYIIGAGLFFMLANFAMKMLVNHSFFILYGVAGFLVLLGIACQAQVFRSVQFGLSVVLILVSEVMFSFLVALFYFQETYTVRNVIGLCLAFVGILVLSGAGEPTDAGAVQVSENHRHPGIRDGGSEASGADVLKEQRSGSAGLMHY